nr:hypothetical protein CFP56_37195 [Quercus suber]
MPSCPTQCIAFLSNFALPLHWPIPKQPSQQFYSAERETGVAVQMAIETQFVPELATGRCLLDTRAGVITGHLRWLHVSLVLRVYFGISGRCGVSSSDSITSNLP